ncbi:unnamed protein product [Calypogeia fissa]
MAGRIRELVSKYGKVALAVHISVSAASFTGCYVAIKNNVDVNDILQRVGLLPNQHHGASELPDGTVVEKIEKVKEEVTEKFDHAAVRVLNEGGAFAMAFLCNKALLPVRVPLTVVLTPPIARVWARARVFRRT